MKDFFIGISLLFVVPSCIYFWIYFLGLHKSKQINLNEIPYYKKHKI